MLIRRNAKRLNPDPSKPHWDCQMMISVWKDWEAQKAFPYRTPLRRVNRIACEDASKCAMCSLISLLQMEVSQDKHIVSFDMVFLPGEKFDTEFKVLRNRVIHNCAFLGIAFGGMESGQKDLIDRIAPSATYTGFGAGARYIKETVDWKRLRGWIELCDKTHGLHSHSRAPAVHREIFRLKVINCIPSQSSVEEDCPVVEFVPEGCQYIA